jgi:predicted acyltransferase
MLKRNESLDALRGFAVLTMILSGAIAYGDVLPAWMFHAQVPPPEHKFNPSIVGITWVDLVFPFFLFCMGAAIPLSLKKHLEGGKGFRFILKIAIKGFLLLAFFALFTQHMKAWVIADDPAAREQLFSILAFVLLFFQFYDNKNEKLAKLFLITRMLSFAIALLLLWKIPFWSNKGFDFYKSDIIIMVLANMALFGTIICYLTANKPLLRIGLLPFIMAVFLAAKEPTDGWAKTVFNFNSVGSLKIDWLYKFYFLKYLLIVIPGTLAGEMIIKKANDNQIRMNKNAEIVLLLVATGLVIMNLYGLFTRILFTNLMVSAALCAAAWWLVRKETPGQLYRQMIAAGSYLLLLGLLFESYEGGIKKDSSTYSYYFVSGGLAFYCLLIFSLFTTQRHFSPLVHYFALNGKTQWLPMWQAIWCCCPY